MTDRVVVVKSNSCPGCDEFLREFNNDGIKQAIKDSTGIGKIEVVDIDHDPIAANVVASLNTYEIPLIATIKENNGKTEVCHLGDDLKVTKCAQLIQLPD